MHKLFRVCFFIIFLPLVSLPVWPNNQIEDPLDKFNSQYWWFSDGWKNGFPFVNNWSIEAISYKQNAMLITLFFNNVFSKYKKNNLTSGELRSKEYFSYGCFEIEIKPVSTPGVITSFFLFAGPNDNPKNGLGSHNEIDIEFLGVNTQMVQMNFWTNDLLYENGHETLVFLDFDAAQDFHHYAISWEENSIEWFVDNKSVLKVMNHINDPIPNAKGSKLRVMANLWAIDSELKEWAGKLKLNLDDKIVAKYRNFKYTPKTRCNHIYGIALD